MKSKNQILESKIQEKWIPKLDAKFKELGLANVSENRKKTIAKMSHIRQLKEQRIMEAAAPGYSFATLNNVPGRGAYNLGNNPANGVSGFYGGQPYGSAEVFQNLFDVFLEVAAACIVFDLVPTIPMTKSSGTIYVAEPIYTGGKIDDADNKPLVVQVKAVKTGTPTALVVGTQYTIKTANTGGENVALVTFIGKHRISGNYVFKIGTQYDNSGTGGTNWQEEVVAELFNTTDSSCAIYTDGSNYFGFTSSTTDYVEGFTNLISGYAGAGGADDKPWFLNRGDGKQYNRPMTRQTGETTYYRPMGLRTWSKNFAAETFQVDIDYTTEQIQDMEMDHGMDAREFGNGIMQDQLTQQINDHVLGRIFALGWSHHYVMNQLNGFNMNANVGLSNTTGTSFAFLGKDDASYTISGAAGMLPATGAIAENLSSMQRRIVTRINYGSGVVNYRSRRGRADIAITNVTNMSALKDIRGYEVAPFTNTIQDSGAAYFAGTLYGINLYEDPLMELTDPRIALARKGNEKDPGVKFCPYILAEKISTIAERTMSPKDALKSRYSVVEAGTNPELNYLTFCVESQSGYQLV